MYGMDGKEIKYKAWVENETHLSCVGENAPVVSAAAAVMYLLQQ